MIWEGFVEKLPQDIIFMIMQHLDVPDLTRWICTNRRIFSLCVEEIRTRTRDRFRVDTNYHSVRLLHEPLENSWLIFYMRLDKACSGWRGFAFDEPTNSFEPYPMELVFQDALQKRVQGSLAVEVGFEASNMDNLSDIRLNELGGFCRWRSLNDSLTKVEGSLVDISLQARFLKDPSTNRELIRYIIFEENQLLRGTNIAVPNRYYGFCDGFVVLGTYDPGFESARGMFCVVVEESIKIPSQLIEFHVGDRFQGLISTCTTRSIHSCLLSITNIDIDQRGLKLLKGNFFVDTSHGLSTLKLEKAPPSWQRAHFSAVCEYDDKEIVLKNVCFSGQRHLLIPNQEMKIIRQGQVMIGFFKNPQASCFYLYSSQKRDCHPI